MIPLLTIWMLLQIRTPIPEHDPVPDDREVELMEHMHEFLDAINKTRQYKRRLIEANAIIPLILKYCEKHNVDVLKAAVIAR